jgi:hypothetical protein
MANYTFDLISVLHADARASDCAERLGLYGQFVGDWDAHIVTYPPGGGQDVWMIPRRQERGPDTPLLPVAGTANSAVARQPASERSQV